LWFEPSRQQSLPGEFQALRRFDLHQENVLRAYLLKIAHFDGLLLYFAEYDREVELAVESGPLLLVVP
jgi:hypothetical protein